MTLDSTEISGFPKIELHVHLEGTVDLPLLRTRASRHKRDLPSCIDPASHSYPEAMSFDDFIQIYIAITHTFRQTEDYIEAILGHASIMARQGIIYSEITFSPGTHRMLGVPDQIFLEGLSEGRRRAFAEHNVTINWVFDIVRNVPDIDREGDYVTALALECRDEGVVALGLGGKEAGYPPKPFEKWFRTAKEAGLKSVPHAGETAGAGSVRDAIEFLAADRIGHGVRAVEDPGLLNLIRERNVHLEVCPTSNYILGVFPRSVIHPVDYLFRNDISMSLNTDDPGIMGVSLDHEWRYCGDNFQWSTSDFLQMTEHAIEASCAPDSLKADLSARLRETQANL